MKRILVLVIVGLISLPALGAGRFDFSGFATIGAAVTDADETIRNFNRKVNVHDDSRAGITIQLLAEGKSGEFAPQMEWAVAAWQPTSTYTLRLGKQKFGGWLVSDYLDVGVLYPWVRPPMEVYPNNPISSFVGMTHEWNFELAHQYMIRMSLMGGGSKRTEEVKGSFSYEMSSSIDDLVGAMVSVSNEVAQLRLSYTQAHIEGEAVIKSSTTCTPIICPGAPPGSSLQSDLVSGVDFGLGKYFNLGFKFDNGKYLAMGELVTLNHTNDFLKELQSHYVTLGIYYGADNKWLTHVTRSAEDKVDASFASGTMTSLTLGTNYQLSPSMVGKVEWSQAKAKDGSGKFDSDPGRAVNIVSTALALAF